MRSAHSLVSKHTKDKLTFAAGVSLSKLGKRGAATNVKEATETTSTRARKIKKSYLTPTSHPDPFTSMEASVLFVNVQMTKHRYYL